MTANLLRLAAVLHELADVLTDMAEETLAPGAVSRPENPATPETDSDTGEALRGPQNGDSMSLTLDVTQAETENADD